MINSREYQCIKETYEARIASARHRLEHLRASGLPFDSPCDFSSDKFWEDEPRERMKQILWMPIVFIPIAFLYLLSLGVYLLELWELMAKKRSLKKEIAGIIPDFTNAEVPTVKTLESLWRLHGLDNSTYSSEEQVELLTKWVEILYGKKNAESVNLDQRVSEIRTCHIKANLPYYEGKSDAPHFLFVPPVDCMISDLSKEVREYDQSG